MFAKNNTFQTQDTVRLKNSFFSQTIDSEIPKKTKKKFNLLFLLLFVFVAIVLFVLANFQIAILPKQNLNVSKTSLLKDAGNSSITLNDPWDNSRITKNVIFLDIPENTKSGVNINFKTPINLDTSRIVLILKNPLNTISLEVVARDQNYRSNARDPLKISVAPAVNKTNYIKVPVHYNKITFPRLKINTINQIRLIFSENKKGSEPIIINDIILEKKEVPLK